MELCWLDISFDYEHLSLCDRLFYVWISLPGLTISEFSIKEYANCIGIPIRVLWCCLHEFRLHTVEVIEPNAKEEKNEIYKFN